jgi:N-acyl homoserine lactone hydrolase
MWKRSLRISSALLVGVALWVASWFLPVRLPVTLPAQHALPRAQPPAALSVSRIDTGSVDARAAFAYRGGGFDDARSFAQTALLVRHPKGDLLIDTGLGEHALAHFARTTWAMRSVSRVRPTRSAAAQLEAAGYPLARLRAILPTHAHWDHVSGVPDFAGVPVWLNAAEQAFVVHGGRPAELMRSFAGVRVEPYTFRSGPYLGFPESHDVWGDGSLVLVKAPGHTPGSILVFLALPSGTRLLLLGDLVWQEEGVRLPAERPAPSRALVDDDAEGVRLAIARVAGLCARFPELVPLPAHDARALARVPVFPAALR